MKAAAAISAANVWQWKISAIIINGEIESGEVMTNRIISNENSNDTMA